MTPYLKAFAILLPVAVTACAPRGPERVGMQDPTVSYSYSYGDEEEAKQEAAKYCYENYGRSARVIEDARGNDGGVMTFECVMTR